MAMVVLWFELDFYFGQSGWDALPSSSGHLAEGQNRRCGRNPYVATKPLLGGLRAETKPAQDKLVRCIRARQPLKICQTFLRYANSPVLMAKPNFVLVPVYDCAEADVIVLEKLADIDLAAGNPHLARGLLLVLCSHQISAMSWKLSGSNC